MDPISSVSSLQHCLAVFLHSFFFFFLAFFFSAHFSQPDFCFPLFCFSISIFGFALHVHISSWHLLFLIPHVRRSWQNAQDPVALHWKDDWLPQIKHSSHCFSNRGHTSGICVWTNGTMTAPHGSASSEGRDHKNLLLFFLLTGYLYRKRESHDYELPCAEPAHGSHPVF